MATYRSTKAKAEIAGSAPIGGGHGLQGVVRCKYATVNVTAAPAQNDIVDFFTLPKGTSIVDAMLVSSDMDTNGSPTATMDVGITGIQANYVFDGSTSVATGTIDRNVSTNCLTAAPLDEDYMLSGVFATAVATGAVGTVTLIVFYVQEDFAVS